MSTPSEPVDLPRWFPDAAGTPDLEAWRVLADKALRGRPLDRLTREVVPGVELPPLVAEGRADVAPVGRTGPWQIRQEVRGPGLKAASRALQAEVSGGVEAPWIRVDASTRLGVRPDEARDPDPDPGVTLLTRDDLAGLLRRVDLSSTPIVLEAGANGLALTAALLAVAADQGVEPAALRATVQADPLGTLARDGRLPRGVDAAFDDLGATLRHVRDHAPHLRVVSLSALPAAEAGADAGTELGVLLASLAETARRLEVRGLDLADWMPHAELQVSLGRDLLTDLAKLRAARRLIRQLLTACGAPDARPFLHARMADAVLAHRDPWTNLLRATQAGFVGATGGADALTLLPFDRGLGESTAQARRIARNLQLLLREESHLDRVEDPAAGSGAIEHLTDGIARRAWDVLQELEGEGGLLAVLGSGTLADRLATRRATLSERIRRRQDVLVGVSRYVDPDAERVTRTTRDPQAVDTQLRSRWEAASMAQDQRQGDVALQDALAALRAETSDRLPHAFVAARAGLLLAELAGTVPGMAYTARALPTFRPASLWEGLADAVRGHESSPGVFLANLGPLPVHGPRADFARELFEAGGFRVHGTDGFDDPDEAAIAFGTSGCRIACICGTDNDYERVVPVLAEQLSAAGAAAVLVAGRFPEDPEPWRDAGVTGVVHLGADVLTTLARVARAAGIDVPSEVCA